ncbi:MAG: flagellar export chaperone FliS [Actinomycetota bacterium]
MNNPRAAYMGQMVNTANPQRLLVMLYDRLVLDVQRALEAQQAGDHVAAGQQLMHAQEIVLELSSSLKPELWDGAERLSSIYSWLVSELMRANIERDAKITEDCLGVITPLADAWREAATTALAAG